MYTDNFSVILALMINNTIGVYGCDKLYCSVMLYRDSSSYWITLLDESSSAQMADHNTQQPHREAVYCWKNQQQSNY